MKKFLLLLHQDIEKMIRLSPEAMEILGQAHLAWATQLAVSGHLVSGNSLHQKGVLLSGRDMVVDNVPYMKGGELVVGYYLLQADNLDMAVGIARGCPAHLWGGTTEIRPVAEVETGDE